MKVAIIGSRTLTVTNLERYLPSNTTEIISGGAQGVDSSARAYVLAHALPLTEFLPDYPQFGRSAPLRRNVQIVEAADLVLAFWDGHSSGTRYTIRCCRERGVPVKILCPIPQKP